MLAHDPPRGVILNPWQKVGGGMGQGTATELTYLKVSTFFSAAIR